MNKNSCFSEIKTKANGLVSFLESLINLGLAWKEHFGFEAFPIETYWIEKEAALKEIDKIHPIKHLGLLKIPKKAFYNWPLDSLVLIY